MAETSKRQAHIEENRQPGGELSESAKSEAQLPPIRQTADVGGQCNTCAQPRGGMQRGAWCAGPASRRVSGRGGYWQVDANSVETPGMLDADTDPPCRSTTMALTMREAEAAASHAVAGARAESTLQKRSNERQMFSGMPWPECARTTRRCRRAAPRRR